jgi:hypothetical protein
MKEGEFLGIKVRNWIAHSDYEKRAKDYLERTTPQVTKVEVIPLEYIENCRESIQDFLKKEGYNTDKIDWSKNDIVGYKASKSNLRKAINRKLSKEASLKEHGFYQKDKAGFVMTCGRDKNPELEDYQGREKEFIFMIFLDKQLTDEQFFKAFVHEFFHIFEKLLGLKLASLVEKYWVGAV